MCIDEPLHKRNWRLYHLLDLISPVSAKQIKWNFRKVTLRHHYYQAYLVLYNKSRKFLYDSTGEDGYGFITSGTWGPFVPLLGSAGVIVFYCIYMLIQIAMLILFFAFLAVRVDKVVDWNWLAVVAPLVVFAVLMLLMCLVALIVNIASKRTYDEGMNVMDRLSPVGNFIASICYFCIPIVIGVKIKNDTNIQVGNYLKFMAMPILGDFFYYLTSLIWRYPRRLRLQMKVDDNVPNPVISWGIFFLGIATMLCGIAQWVLIGCKLDNRLDRSWYIIFIPFCFRAGIRIAEACLRSLMKHSIGVKTSIGVAFDTVGSFFVNGMLLVSLYFVAVRIHRGQRKVKMAHALIPVYIVLGYIFLTLIFSLIYLLVKNSERKKTENRIDASWTPPPERVEGVTGGAIGGTGSTEDSFPKENHGWDELDETVSSSAAFPEEMYDEEGTLDVDPRSVRDDGEYEDFYTDEEEELFPEEETEEDYSREEDDGYYNQEYTPYSRSTPSRTPRSQQSRSVQSRSRRDSPQSRTPSQQSRGERPRTPSQQSRTPSQQSRRTPQRGGEDDASDSYSSYSGSYEYETTYIEEEVSESYSSDYTDHEEEVESSAFSSTMRSSQAARRQ